MAAAKKMPQWQKVSRDWFEQNLSQLKAMGLTDREMEVLQLRDLENKTFSDIAKGLGCSDTRPMQIYHQIRRRLSHPMRRSFVPEAYRIKK